MPGVWAAAAIGAIGVEAQSNGSVKLMKITKKQTKPWTKPELNKLGKLTDVAKPAGAGQGIGNPFS